MLDGFWPKVTNSLTKIDPHRNLSNNNILCYKKTKKVLSLLRLKYDGLIEIRGCQTDSCNTIIL